MRQVDLRSDTVTKPTLEMRKVIFEAKVGDDVFGEDPSVNELEAFVADLLGKEAALFVPSGTMGNQIAINCHTQPGDELICEMGCHLYNYEAGAPALLSGVQIRPIPGIRGVITAEQIEASLRPENDHFARQTLVTIENTHNSAGGAIFPLDEIVKIGKLLRSRCLRFHMDGARLWNACVATNISEKEYAAPFDSVMVCLSKGLGAPVGSVLTGGREFVRLARKYRKIYGGGMRQAGIIAAAGLYAIQHNRERLVVDHQRAKMLAQALFQYSDVEINIENVQTNIVIADFGGTGKAAQEIVEKMQKHGVKCLAVSKNKIRMVTHLDLEDKDIDWTIEILKKILKQDI